jgi:hypothetical protein
VLRNYFNAATRISRKLDETWRWPSVKPQMDVPRARVKNKAGQNPLFAGAQGALDIDHRYYPS